MEIKQRYELWLKNVKDDTLLSELKSFENDMQKINNAFYKDLTFGTGGLRGEIGAGTNCLNIYTIGKVTQGIADCMKKYGYKTAAVSCDSRINSDLFARRAAAVFASNGITCHITKELMPTPFLSYITRELNADIGVMITASHNPAKYNGYKVYGGDGCQLTDTRALEMTDYIEKVDEFSVSDLSFEEGLKSGLITYVSDKLEADYLSRVKEQSVTNGAEGLNVVYSPLNGTGYRLVPKILEMSGVENITFVPEQAMPDGNFPTCSYPNPEKPAALKLGLELLERTGADILIATDPDADRVGIAIKTADGYPLLSGNEVGCLLADFILANKKNLPKNPIVVKTIVSSALGEKVASSYGAEVRDVLTGFKYIGEIAGQLEKVGEENRFVLGYEESYGYLSGAYVRDKDAVVASMLIAEMAAFYKKQGKTLKDRIEEIYAKFGTYEHKTISFEYPGMEGSAKMKALLENIRKNPITNIGGEKVVKFIDYLNDDTGLPKADVLSMISEGGYGIIIRPSGTEPLIKIYITVNRTKELNITALALIENEVNALFN